MPSIFKVGFTAVTVASTALAHFNNHHMGLHARQFFNTSVIATGTGYFPTGVFPTGIIPTGTGGGSPTGPTVTPPYANTTSTTIAPPSGTVTIVPTLPTVPTLPPAGTTTISSSQSLTTSTVFATVIQTITSCPPAVVTKCPAHVITVTIPISTTVCPVGEQPKPTPPAGGKPQPTPPAGGNPQPTPPVVIVVPVPPKQTTVLTGVYTITGPSGEQHPVTTVITSVLNPPHPSPVAPFPTGGKGGSSAQGTGTGVIRPTGGVYQPSGILTTKVVTPPQATSPPILEHSAAGKVGVSSVLALMLASVFALMY